MAHHDKKVAHSGTNEAATSKRRAVGDKSVEKDERRNEEKSPKARGRETEACD